MASKARVIWMDGKFVRAANARVHVLSHALHYGSGVYEGIRAYGTPQGPAVFRLRDHVSRLFHSASAFDMPIPYSRRTIERTILATVRRNGFPECYVRPIVFYGEGKMQMNPKGAALHVAVAAWPWGKYLGDRPALSVGVSRYVRFHPRPSCPARRSAVSTPLPCSRGWKRKGAVLTNAFFWTTRDPWPKAPARISSW